MNKKKIYIYNKFYKLDNKLPSNFTYVNNDVQASDRLYTIIDQILSFHIRVKSWLLNFFIVYWFFNNDFQKNKALSTKKINHSRLIINIIFVLSIISLAICLIVGVARPILQSTIDSMNLLSGKFTGKLMSNGNIIGFALSDAQITSVLTEIKTLLSSTSQLETWLDSFLNKVYMPLNGLTDLTTAKTHLLQYLNTHSNNIYTVFDPTIQKLCYFWLVNSSLPDNSLADIFNSFNGQYFTLLNKENLFYGLKVTSICLTSDQTSQVLLVPVIWASWFTDIKVIIPLIFTIIFIVIISVHSHTIKKNKPKFTNMGIYLYVTQKLNFIKKFSFINKKLVFLNKEIKELQHNVITNFHTFDKATMYNTLRLLNYAYNTIESMSIILVADYTDDLYNSYQAMIEQDVTNLAIMVVDEQESPIDNQICSDHTMVYNQYKNYSLFYLDIVNKYMHANKQVFNYNHNKTAELDQISKNKLINEIMTYYQVSSNFNVWQKNHLSLKTFNKQLNQIITKVLNNEKSAD